MAHSQRSVHQVMSEPVLGLESVCSVGQTLELSEHRQIHHFPIFEAHRLVGFLCVCDLRGAPLDSAVRQWMQTNVAEIVPEATTNEAARRMNELGVGSLLVRGKHGICGIVTRGDLAAEMAGLDPRFPELSCAFCGGHEHLRASPSGMYVCLDCTDRAHVDDWFELGSGD